MYMSLILVRYDKIYCIIYLVLCSKEGGFLVKLRFKESKMKSGYRKKEKEVL